MSSSSTQLESSSGLDGDIRFDLYAALGAIGVAVVLAALFWRLYKLTVSARPQDMIPVVDPSAAAAAGDAKLRQRDVAALPVFVHGGGEDDAAVVECAVCLAEMKDGERGRLLPGCGHRFHVDCIDRWFRANSTCPLCRAAAVGRTAPAEEAHKGGAAPPQVVVVVQS
ncbi:hypothetical protein PR202_gb19818 [Eleusine coracana subsp. coracana]|uniref:RING-type domain-containing protein n=1 Tax=Eleusine coracana subsp. coracana TaxID=191504 RepID=A0AAV5F972_ELECO|nr:hypothetical protein QOZ80_3BG0280600 [Eleusine coracana subsp. coracana]GJN31422.1 hypothetical protein PR202_gb19818 [Eleusine coracana subsp. coracana]